MLKHCFNKRSSFDQNNLHGIKDPPHFSGMFHKEAQMFIFLRKMEFLHVFDLKMTAEGTLLVKISIQNVSLFKKVPALFEFGTV